MGAKAIKLGSCLFVFAKIVFPCNHKYHDGHLHVNLSVNVIKN